MKRKRHFVKIILILFFIVGIQSLFGQQNDTVLINRVYNNKSYLNSLDLRALDLFFSIYEITYHRQYDSQDEVILGVFYESNTTTSLSGTTYPGKSQSYSLVLGYRKHLWKNLHLDYQLYLLNRKYFENNEQKNYVSFEIWNEFHLGYQFDFSIMETPFYITPQFLVGFCLNKSNEPQSFKILDKKNPPYHYPDLYIFPNLNVEFKF